MDVLLCGGLLFTLSFERGRVSRLLERPGFLRLEHLASGDVRLSDSLSAAPLLGAHRPQARDGEPDERRSRSNQRRHHRGRDNGAGCGVG